MGFIMLARNTLGNPNVTIPLPTPLFIPEPAALASILIALGLCGLRRARAQVAAIARQHLAIHAIILTAFLSSGARAAFTAFWVPVPFSPAALAEDPTLGSMVTWRLLVTTDGDWLSAAMRVELPPGYTFYQHPLGSIRNPNPATVAQYPALEFTTHVTTPTDNGVNQTTTVLGGWPTGTPSTGSASSTRPGVFSAAWGDLVTSPAGTFEIVRLTWPAVLIVGGTTTANGRTSANPGNVTIPIETPIFVPEPSGLTLTAVGLISAVSGVGRRRSRTGTPRFVRAAA